MPRRNATPLSTALLIGLSIVLAMSTVVCADLKDYVDSQTLLAGEADLTKVDPAALEPWLRADDDRRGHDRERRWALKPEDIDKAMSEMKRWLGDVAKAGGKHIYVVTQFDIIKMGGVAIIIPAEAGGDANKLAALLNSGRPDGPTSRPAQNVNGRDFSMYIPRSQVVNGNLAVFGTPNAINYIKNLKPAARPDVEAALESSGG